MENLEFKQLFDKVAKSNSFIKSYGGWNKETALCIFILELQKSSFSNSFYLNVKIFFKDIFNRKYIISKDLVKSSNGHITKQLRDFDCLNLSAGLENDLREMKLAELFNNHIFGLLSIFASIPSILEHAEKGIIFLTPAVKKELVRSSN